MSREGFVAHQIGAAVLHITNQPPVLIASLYPYIFVAAGAIYCTILKSILFLNNL